MKVIEFYSESHDRLYHFVVAHVTGWIFKPEGVGSGKDATLYVYVAHATEEEEPCFFFARDDAIKLNTLLRAAFGLPE